VSNSPSFEDAAVLKFPVGSPLNGIVEVGGPEQFRFDELIRLALRARGDKRKVIADPHARYFGAKLSERSLVPDAGAKLGRIRLKTGCASGSSSAQAHQREGGQERMIRIRRNSRRTLALGAGLF
jgi:hypothetical protein